MKQKLTNFRKFPSSILPLALKCLKLILHLYFIYLIYNILIQSEVPWCMVFTNYTVLVG